MQSADCANPQIARNIYSTLHTRSPGSSRQFLGFTTNCDHSIHKNKVETFERSPTPSLGSASEKKRRRRRRRRREEEEQEEEEQEQEEENEEEDNNDNNKEEWRRIKYKLIGKLNIAGR